ncbi:MAG: hypothetical protein Q7K11_01280 [Candidatus Berkelbacteria bacterium]|nr:hypothetical protein [Candidatus Berkelbacteria bacterium]
MWEHTVREWDQIICNDGSKTDLDLQEVLDIYSKDGWELVSTAVKYESHIFLFFKRPKEY